MIQTVDAEARARRLRVSSDWYFALAVAAVTFVAFLPALQNGFVAWDDDKNFLQNIHYRGIGRDQLAWMWSTFHLGHYVPLAWMSLGLDYAIWGMDPFGYHLTNLILHCATAVAVYYVAKDILDRSSADTTDRFPVAPFAFIAALLFSIHPLRVESVAWITERRDLLSGVFYFSAVYAYLRSAHPDSPRATRWYLLALACAFGAVLSKATAVTLPVTLLILNIYPLRRLGGAHGWTSDVARRVYARLMPFGVLSAVITIVTFIALQPETQLPIPGKIAVAAYSLLFYVGKTIAPFGLAPLYAMPLSVSPFEPRFAISVSAVIAVAIVLVLLRKRAPGTVVAIFGFGAILFPLLGVHQNGPQIAADRYTYNAAVALAILAAAGVRVLSRKLGTASLAPAGIVIASLATLTWSQSRIWHDSESLWTQVLRVEPASPLALNNYGNVLARRGATSDALSHYKRAVAADPRYADAYDNVGVALAQLGRTDEAFGAFRTAVDIRPEFDEARNNWGVALAAAGRFDDAIEQYRFALQTNASNAVAHINWGNALVRLGRTADALPHYRDAIMLQQDNVDAHHNFGTALALLGDLEGAIAQFTRTLELRSDHAEARQYLAKVKALRGQPPAHRP